MNTITGTGDSATAGAHTSSVRQSSLPFDGASGRETGADRSKRRGCLNAWPWHRVRWRSKAMVAGWRGRIRHAQEGVNTTAERVALKTTISNTHHAADVCVSQRS